MLLRDSKPAYNNADLPVETPKAPPIEGLNAIDIYKKFFEERNKVIAA